MDEITKTNILALTAHIQSMANDAYLSGHPEWVEIVNEALELGEWISTFEISG